MFLCLLCMFMYESSYCISYNLIYITLYVAWHILGYNLSYCGIVGQ
ncbi:hypothetical protein [Staphylococcus phage PT94]